MARVSGGSIAVQSNQQYTDSNHFVGAYSANQLISESLDWLDKYLGAVE